MNVYKKDTERIIIRFGKMMGYISGYFIFTTCLYFILLILDKIPKNWNYLNIILITILITILGMIIKKYLR